MGSPPLVLLHQGTTRAMAVPEGTTAPAKGDRVTLTAGGSAEDAGCQSRGDGRLGLHAWLEPTS